MRSRFALLVLLLLMAEPLMATTTEALTYGYIEKATLVEKSLVLSAKLDTGAKSASLNATNITEINVKGEPYLRFTVPTKTGDYLFECKYMGKVKIKIRANEASSNTLTTAPIKRPVVLLNIKLGDKIRPIRVNLTNRKRFLYPLLLGRDAIIAFNGVIDPAKTFLLSKRPTKNHEE